MVSCGLSAVLRSGADVMDGRRVVDRATFALGYANAFFWITSDTRGVGWLNFIVLSKKVKGGGPDGFKLLSLCNSPCGL